MSPPASPHAPAKEPSSKSPAGEDESQRSSGESDAEEVGEIPDVKSNGDEATAEAPTSKDAPPLPNEPTPDQPPLPKEPTPDGPPLPSEPVPDGPPLPKEAPPPAEDDGWDFQWDPNTNAYFFYNRFTGQSQWENPRLPTGATAASAAVAPGTAPGTALSGPHPPTTEKPAAGGYNPAIHGDYDPNAWYAQGDNQEEQDAEAATAGAVPGVDEPYSSTATFNRFTGQFQSDDMGPGRHTDEAKSRRQMNAFFDVDAAANAHDGRSLKAERQNKKPSKAELKAFKEKRRARKEEKRRAWLRD